MNDLGVALISKIILRTVTEKDFKDYGYPFSDIIYVIQEYGDTLYRMNIETEIWPHSIAFSNTNVSHVEEIDDGYNVYFHEPTT